MMYSTNGFIDTNNGDNSSTSNPRIVELPGNSPLSKPLDNIPVNSFDNNDTSKPIVTTPDSGTLSYMPSPSPSNMSSMALINSPRQPRQQNQQQQQQFQQQQASDAAMALLSSLSSSNTSPSALSQGGNSTTGRNGNNSRSRATSKNSANSPTTGAPVPLASNLQTLQPLNRPPNGVRGNVAAFLSKLYNMVGDEASNNLIRWSNDGQSFLVINHVEFAKEVLPKFFKHNNFASFVRQLNMYGFHKVPHLQQGVLMPDVDSEQWEFSNPNFQRNQPDLLYLVARKKASGTNEDKDALTMDVGHILQEVAAIKRHQVAISTELKNIERDHQSLWQESVTARERHQRQQETIDKILRFLASVFSGDKKRAIVPNKKARLTITDGESASSLDDGRRLVEEEEEEEEEEVEEEEEENNNQYGAKRKRSSNDDGSNDAAVNGVPNISKPSLSISEMTPATLAMLANMRSTGGTNKAPVPPTTKARNNNTPPLPTVSAATSNFNLPDYLNTFSGLNYAGNNINTAGFKFDPSNLTIPTTLLPNALSPVHHDMLQQISMANARDTNTHSNAPPLPPLPPSLTHTPSGANVSKGVDQIAQEIEQLQQSIQDLSQHQLIGDNFDFDDDSYMPLTDQYGDLGNIYHNYSTNSAVPISSSTVPTSSTLSSSSAIGSNPRISTVDEDYLEDLLDLDPV
ncbi:stress-responsive transcription factor hsf1 [Mortierella sp. AM989]|nr:stress-responsive transcription factor hsf1 [Mortierella sp. AM989]